MPRFHRHVELGCESVQHEINFQKVRNLRLSQEVFPFRACDADELSKTIQSNLRDMYPREVDFSRWCIDYIRHLFIARHGGSKDHLRYAQDALHWGSSYTRI